MERRSRISLDDPVFRGRAPATQGAASYRRPYAPVSVDGFQKPPPKQAPIRARPAAIPPAPVVPVPVYTFQAPPPKPLVHLPKQSRSHVLKRQMVKGDSKKYRPKHRRPLMPTLLSGMAIALFSVGLLVVFSSLKTDRTVKAQVKQLTQQTDDSGEGAPSEDDQPADLSGYGVAPDLPRLLTIEKIGVHARVKRLGVDSNNVMKSPSNIFDIGWYDGSAKPGENGTVVLDGHVSGPTKHGVFYSIGSLKAGDRVELERGDGKVFSYTVTGSQVYDNDKVDMAKVMTTSVPGKPGLNFMTCTGRFNVRTNTFEQRVVVFAVQN